MNEISIIKKCQAGHLEEFASIYDLYVQKIYKFIFFKTMHRETAEDLTSQTFTKAMEALANFDEQKGSFSTWLYRIARNNVIDYYRTVKKTEDIDGIYNLSDDQNLPLEIDIKNQLDEINKYLNKIKPEHREIVIMRLWQDMTYQEISQITGKTLAGCKMAFSRTICKLREEMALNLIALIILIINLTNI